MKMKKVLLVLTLAVALILGSMGSVFAAEGEDTTVQPNFGRGYGVFHSQSLSVEELLKQKIEAIDKLVEDKKITKEQGEEYKQLITERMGNCTTVGENREDNERLGIGFGRTNGMGRGNGLGRGMGFGRGVSNNL